MRLPAFELPRPDLSPWRQGNTGVEGVWHLDGPQPGRRVLVTALVHGNELCGAWALVDLLRHGFAPRRGALTLAFCNLEAFDRFDPSDPDASRFVEQDFNRVWGPPSQSGASTLELRRALKLRPFVERADWLLDLHSMHEPGPALLLTGPHERNVALAKALRSPAHVIVDAGHAEGRRMRDHGQFGDAHDTACSLLIECGWHGAVTSRDVALDLVARFLVASGAMDAGDLPAAWWQPDAEAQRVLDVTEAIVARSMDTRFARPWDCGQVLPHAGTVLGWRESEPFVTPYDDCTLVMPSLRQLRPGVTVMRLARSR